MTAERLTVRINTKATQVFVCRLRGRARVCALWPRGWPRVCPVVPRMAPRVPGGPALVAGGPGAAPVDIPKEELMGMRWVLTWKPSADVPGDVKAKARIVILGYQHPELTELNVASPTLSRLGRALTAVVTLCDLISTMRLSNLRDMLGNPIPATHAGLMRQVAAEKEKEEPISHALVEIEEKRKRESEAARQRERETEA